MIGISKKPSAHLDHKQPVPFPKSPSRRAVVGKYYADVEKDLGGLSAY